MAINKDTYIKRRTRLKNDVGSGLLLFLGNDEVGMNYADNTYRFRQDSTFLYFFGLDYPALAAAYNMRHEMYNRQMEEIYERADSGQSIVICPPYNPDISRTEKDPYELERVYQLGRKEASKRISEVKAFLSE